MPFPHPRGYVCPMCPEPPTFGLGLEDGAWADAPWSEDFLDIEGPEKSKPRYRTRVKMLWDDAYFYVGAELEEPHLWATFTEHDSVIFQDNDFEVFIDPDGDNHQYYEYEINALGTDWDLRLVKPYRDGGPALNPWEIPGLKKRVTLHGTLNDPRDTDEGWTVELAFPWEVLAEYAGRPAPPVVGDQWRVNFSRVQWQLAETEHGYEKIPGIPEDNWVWSPQWAVDMHRPELWGYVQFERGHKPFRNDEDWGVKCELMELYYEQKRFHKLHRTWAEITELTNTMNGSVRLAVDGAGFRASLIGKHGVYTVGQDSRLAFRRH
ncbi:MAG: carbohydrate-binding family 9-like protein [Fimbriimonadaceae bacterium]|nr:carbohydrate-binding family 9-like protein [Fimbriimonadaceae bacterium]QYK54917.1 MAG: carbohydrate-binding family 9-like protein [Fimbriimonadaceae bacterium]